MSWHIIRAFQGMLPWSRSPLRDNLVKKSLGVISNIRVVVLVDGKRSACVMQEEMSKATLKFGQIGGNFLQYLGSDEMATSTMRRKSDGLLSPLGAGGGGGHGGISDWSRGERISYAKSGSRGKLR